jgi:hypothetical protein
MTEYVRQIRIALRDQHKFQPTGGTEEEPLFNNIPDGEYPIKINGKVDNVLIKKGAIHCCRFK